MDASDFGRYGTLYLLKRHEPDAIIAPYPIDEPEISLGRDSACSIRLYYADVSAVHCKVVFNDQAKVRLLPRFERQAVWLHAPRLLLSS